jgi:hypothetical protein
MNEERKSGDPYFAQGCLGFVAIFVFSIAGAFALFYAAQWLFGF